MEDLERRIEEERRLGGIEAGINSVRQSVDSLTGKIGEAIAQTHNNTAQINDLAIQLTLHLEEVKNRRAWERLDNAEEAIKNLTDNHKESKVASRVRSRDLAILGTIIAIVAGVGATIAKIIAQLIAGG